jgi:hypothetical protein
MPKRDRADYMREYRARKRLEAGLVDPVVTHEGFIGRDGTAVVWEVGEEKPVIDQRPGGDCALCGHDRSFYHAGRCTFLHDDRTRCGCAAWVDPVEPF